ncbi:MAG TPA: hypothetical protein VFG49_14765 [Dyella sp.]|uniref:hypothetical protein n=1 Tax=Dyella sp. TaxID=1869338 RepID=UPI002D782AB6|nr:hypothetical protein [Dyella sp.]HET6554786.1 hypothetical protein [Dyella sp.]
MGTAGAQNAAGCISFAGQIVEASCNSERMQPGGCGEQGLRAINMELVARAPNGTDSAMLDSFADRSTNDIGLVRTRQCR